MKNMMDNKQVQQILAKVEQAVPGAKAHLDNWMQNNPDEFNKVIQECQASGNLDPIITRVKSLIASSTQGGNLGNLYGNRPKNPS